MEDAINNKDDDTNIAIVVNATLIETYHGANISVHADQTWAYKFHIPHWPRGADLLLARGEAELQLGMGYMLHGHLSINEGRGWTRTAFEVDDAVELCRAARCDDPAPEFRLAGWVLETTDECVTLGWERYDADWGNFAWVYVKVRCPVASEGMRSRWFYVEGTMDGFDRMRDWVANTITPAP
ncbi:hypothetical protein DSL72_001737 [Monilinia vaccinii-corymbosi]|uniref:Uncharacterized protein n=1 Tax=Monilinia vaccinii-corymbosi TaxID=61207 RepID=A0A8A3P7U1_9HELO|nr:hypothetical protein DSL72_001737 [Monilinia vaccinii-corymbosi]